MKTRQKAPPEIVAKAAALARETGEKQWVVEVAGELKIHAKTTIDLLPRDAVRIEAECYPGGRTVWWGGVER